VNPKRETRGATGVHGSGCSFLTAPAAVVLLLMLVLAKGSERDEAAGSRGFLWAAARGVGADLLVVEVVAVVVVLWEDFGWRGVVNSEGRAGMEALSCVELCCVERCCECDGTGEALPVHGFRALHFTEICSITPPSLVC
jgi:hypothetical protein